MNRLQNILIHCALFVNLIPSIVLATEFTFELDDSNEACFNEIIDAGTPVTLAYQVKSV